MCQNHAFHIKGNVQLAMKMAQLQLFFPTPECYYRVTLYNEAIDLILNCLADRFDQPGYRMYSTLEQLLLKACKRQCYEEEMATKSERYSADIDIANLKIQLQTLSINMNCDLDVTVENVVKYLRELSPVGRSLYSEVTTLVKLILVMPASNASSERSFSALRRLKTYLRSTMSQVRLNNLMVLHIHSDRLDKLDLCQFGNEFINTRSTRKLIFGLFSDT